MMANKVFLNWLRTEIVLHHNPYMTVATALRAIEERRSRAEARLDSTYLEQLRIVEEELRKCPAESSLLAVQFAAENRSSGAA